MRELRLYIQLMGLSLVNVTDKLHDMSHDLLKLSIQKVGVGLSRQTIAEIPFISETTLRKPQPSCRWSAKPVFSESKPRNINTYIHTYIHYLFRQVSKGKLKS